MLVLLILAVGFVGYVYKKNAMFLPALFGIGGFPNIKKKDYYQADGTFRKAEKDDKMAFFMQHPVFGGYKHMFFNVEDNVLKAIAPAKYADFLKAQGRSDQMENALEAFNYLTRLVESGEAQLISDINSKEMIEQNPYQSHLTGMFYKGKQGKPLAVVVPGGGFISNVTDCEGYPVAMKLHKLGYSVLVISYPIGKQLGETEHEKQGQAAVRELVQVIRYLKEHEQELSVDMDDYAIFGFSAGGMMTTAYSFANYEDCCHKVKLPRPKVIFPMYGLDWNVKALEQDKGLAVFSIAGREDEYGFGNVEKRLPQLKSVLGEDNVSVPSMGEEMHLDSPRCMAHWTGALLFAFCCAAPMVLLLINKARELKGRFMVGLIVFCAILLTMLVLLLTVGKSAIIENIPMQAAYVLLFLLNFTNIFPVKKAEKAPAKEAATV